MLCKIVFEFAILAIVKPMPATIFTSRCFLVVICFSLIFVSGTLFSQPPSSPRILCSVFPVFLITREIASGTNGVVDLFVPSNFGCPHDYSLTPGDIQNFQKADLVIFNGLGFEPFLDRISKDQNKAIFIDCSQKIEFLPDSLATQKPNPHIFTTPNGLLQMAENVTTELSKIFPQNSSQYRFNFRGFSERLRKVESAWRAVAKELASVSVVLTHSSEDYLAKDLGLSVIARIEIGHEEEISPRELMNLIKLIQREKPRAVLVDDQHASKILETVFNETRIPLLRLNFFSSGEKSSSSEYIEATFLENIRRLKMLLSKTRHFDSQ
ncbi:metal ABC transporter substrate-binding protein [bacterium]|nr:metal ABC transporter substrate-binding protein [bacterium]